MRNMKRVLMDKGERNSPLGRTRSRWNDNIKTYVKDIE
jgi:hypothetical protein